MEILELKEQEGEIRNIRTLNSLEDFERKCFVVIHITQTTGLHKASTKYRGFFVRKNIAIIVT